MKLVTFGYRYKRTEPVGADVVFDARCLKEDPGEKEQLRGLTGKDVQVQTYLDTLEDVQKFINVVFYGTFSIAQGDFTVAVACHSGRHRSVYIAERVGEMLRVPVEHLDIDRVPEEDGAPDFV